MIIDRKWVRLEQDHCGIWLWKVGVVGHRCPQCGGESWTAAGSARTAESALAAATRASDLGEPT